MLNSHMCELINGDNSEILGVVRCPIKKISPKCQFSSNNSKLIDTKTNQTDCRIEISTSANDRRFIILLTFHLETEVEKKSRPRGFMKCARVRENEESTKSGRNASLHLNTSISI